MWPILAAAAITTIGGLIASDQQRRAARDVASAQREGLSEAAAIQQQAISEQKREFDLEMRDYRQKQAQLNQQWGQLQTMLAPYQQGGQGAFYEMLALSGIASPEGATVMPGITVGGPAATAPTEAGKMGILSTGTTANLTGGERFNLPANIDPMDVAAELFKGGTSLSSDRWNLVDQGVADRGEASPRYYAAMLSQQLREQHPDWTTQDIHDYIAQEAPIIAEERAYGSQTPGLTISPAENPYAGMTGTEAQAAAIQRISDSPLLQELTRQGEQGILQNAAATGGLRGGNVQGVLAQYRPAMLNQAINEQYSRLAGITGTGLGATTAAPYTPQANMPSSNVNYSGLTNIAMQTGSVNAAQALAEAQARADMIGSVAGGIGAGIGAYYGNQAPASTSTAAGSGTLGGFQVVANPNGGYSYVDQYGNYFN